LQWRLTAWVAAVLLISAAAVFAVVYQETGSQLTDQIDLEIRSDASELAQTVASLGSTPAQVAAGARRYVNAQGYTAASPLLFVVVPGQPTASNHPEVFGGGPGEPGETAEDQARENAEGQRLLATGDGYSDHRLADAGQVRVFVGRVTVAGVSVLYGAGESLAVVERAQHSVAATFLLAGAIVLLIALIASYLAGSRVSAPLRQMAGVATRVDAGELAPRMDSDASRTDEVQVLAEAFNRMLDRLEEAFAAQREFVADASHELRTPLTVIRGQLEVLAAQANPPVEEIRRVERLVQAEISRIARLVDDLLLLAQAERTDFLRLDEVDLESFVGDLWDGLSHTAERRFEVGALSAGVVTADPDRLAQALRNLARNAIEHTAPGAGLVRIDVERVGHDRVRFSVTDDGPGIPEPERERVFERFHRTDASRTRTEGGTGLGLAIVKAITEAHGGRVRALGAGDHPGARVELVLPRYRPVA
jgi:signal transduction histidine kinase